MSRKNTQNKSLYDVIIISDYFENYINIVIKENL